MVRYGLVLALMSAALPAAVQAQSEMPPELVEAARHPGGDAILRRAKEEDHRQVVRMNLEQARSTARRDQQLVDARDSANARAQERYRADMAEWHRRVDACRSGAWSQCDR